mmetsp:Transcript_25971/g.49113  ORF Transcript_25971/g.49113 Transcript_25971/m.49113 type:complete len:291 (+) Transcript_25971:696-1568(+)
MFDACHTSSTSPGTKILAPLAHFGCTSAPVAMTCSPSFDLSSVVSKHLGCRLNVNKQARVPGGAAKLEHSVCKFQFSMVDSHCALVSSAASDAQIFAGGLSCSGCCTPSITLMIMPWWSSVNSCWLVCSWLVSSLYAKYVLRSFAMPKRQIGTKEDSVALNSKRSRGGAHGFAKSCKTTSSGPGLPQRERDLVSTVRSLSLVSATPTMLFEDRITASGLLHVLACSKQYKCTCCFAPRVRCSPVMTATCLPLTATGAKPASTVGLKQDHARSTDILSTTKSPSMSSFCKG